MLEALYNMAILAETGAVTYMAGKLGLDFAWQKTVEFMCERNLWNKPEVEAVMAVLMKEKM